ncbi:MAG: phosphomevalonate kinase, partial [Atopostipes sp.]|nr:phosphomevalonate kinase [Atopostipes sp.]
LLANSLKRNNQRGIKKAIIQNRQALLEMGKQTKLIIETNELKKLINLANNYHAVAKTSGAGGGDSGIAFVFKPGELESLIEDWQKAGITPLDLNVYTK